MSDGVDGGFVGSGCGLTVINRRCNLRISAGNSEQTAAGFSQGFSLQTLRLYNSLHTESVRTEPGDRGLYRTVDSADPGPCGLNTLQIYSYI